MPLTQLLFSFRGRINRLPFWLASIAVALVLIVLVILSFGLGGPTEGTALVIFVLYLPVAYVGLALGTKRLHDRDKSGWWLLLFYVLPGILQWLADMAGGAGIILQVIALVLNIWALIELGFLRGTPWPNRFGPDPLATPTA